MASGARPQEAPSPAAGDFGLTPQDLHSAYELPAGAAAPQTVAIVDAYHDPTAESDLQAYGQTFGLQGECTTANGCFMQVNQNGEAGNPPFPKSTAELELAHKGTAKQKELATSAEGWGLEISLDIEATRAICQTCHILLVEANSPSYEDLEAAEATAAALGATEISNSWGGPEAGETPALESSSPFNHPGIVITASAGDTGYLGWGAESPFERGFAEFPASSPHVVAVGGTHLSVGAGGGWAGESVWNGNGAGGGGCSVEFAAQPWQLATASWSDVGCAGARAVADVSADADPYTGVAVHDSSAQCEATYEEAKVKHVTHWCAVGGTSLASPLIASVYALAGGAAGVSYPAKTLYDNQPASPQSLHDVVTGSNGACSKGFDHETGLSACTPAEASQSCSARLICLAAAGYDGPTGVGTPRGIAAFQPQPPGEGTSEAGKGQGAGGAAPGSAAGPPLAGAGASGSPGTGPPPAGGANPAIRISKLTLTRAAVLSLKRGRARLSRVGFAFQINLPTRVRATLARRVGKGSHARWQMLRASLSFSATGGYNRRRLPGRGILAAGLYRLTVSPPQGTARSIVFRAG